MSRQTEGVSALYLQQILCDFSGPSKDLPHLSENRDRSISGRSRFHTLRKHAASSDLRRSGGVPTRRLKKESWN